MWSRRRSNRWSGARCFSIPPPDGPTSMRSRRSWSGSPGVHSRARRSLDRRRDGARAQRRFGHDGRVLTRLADRTGAEFPLRRRRRNGRRRGGRDGERDRGRHHPRLCRRAGSRPVRMTNASCSCRMRWKQANRKILDYQTAQYEARGMGSTGVVRADRAARCRGRVGRRQPRLLLRQSGFRQLTKDHSLVQRLIEIGQITAGRGASSRA